MDLLQFGLMTRMFSGLARGCCAIVWDGTENSAAVIVKEVSP